MTTLITFENVIAIDDDLAEDEAAEYALSVLPTVVLTCPLSSEGVDVQRV